MSRLLVLAFLGIAQVATAQVVRYEATIKNVKYVYGPAEPVARVKPGQTIEANTLDAFGDVIRKPGDTMSMVKGDNPLTGPFYIEGAEPGDTLAVRIDQIDVNGTQGVGAMAPGFGTLNPTTYTPMLVADLPERIWFYDIDNKNNVATFKAGDSGFTVKIPMHPFLGCIGVAPPGGESRMSITPGEWGGKWIHRKLASDTPCISRSASPARFSTSATATPRRVKAKWAAPGLKCR